MIVKRKLALLALAWVGLLHPVALRAQRNQAEEAASLMRRAAEISDFRSIEQPGFRIRARVRLLGTDSEFLQGNYLLAWASPGQWREEVSVAHYQEIRVVREGKLWRQRNVSYQPLRIYQLVQTLDFRAHLRLRPKESTGKVRKRKSGGVPIQCVELRWEDQRSRELCFEQVAGVLRRVEASRFTYEYADCVPLGEKLFPQRLRLFESGQLVVEVEVEELTTKPELDLNFFASLHPAEVWDWCANPEPAERTEHSYPYYPHSARQAGVMGTVSVYAVIGTDGKLHDMTVVGSAGPQLDAATLQALRSWRYRPRMCSGTPVPQEIVIDTIFRIQ